MRSNDNSKNQDSVPDGLSIEQSENIANSDGNFETEVLTAANSNEGNNEHQSDGMMMDDGDNATEEDGPTIIVVNHTDSVPDGSCYEESENISQQNTVDSSMIDSNENDKDHSSGQEMLDGEENGTQDGSEPGQAGPSIGSNSNPTSTLTRRSTRASTTKKVNYSKAIENSVTGQQDTLTGTRKRKRKTGSGKANAPKRSRGVPTPTVSAEETDKSDDEDEGDLESEATPLSIIVRRLNCPGCKKVFPGKVQLDGHLLTKHGIEKYACKVKDCTESYATKGELTTHRNSAHDNLDNEWPCAQCEVTCNTYQVLRVHTYHYHEYGLFACSSDKCDFAEKTRRKVQVHQRKHRPAKYRCTYPGCFSSFNMKSNLTIHFRVHNQETPFLCSQCPKAFAKKSNLTDHERIHSGLKPYSCTWPHCDYTARKQSDVISHIRGVHFGLPKTKKKQKEKGIIDNRDARLFLKKTIPNGN